MKHTVKVPPEVAEVLRRSTITAGQVLLPPEQLPRELYEQLDKVLRAAGGRWDRRLRAHVFATRDAREALGQGRATEVVDVKKQTQAFYTPPALARQLVALAGARRGDSVLEPSAGHGAIAAEVVATGAEVTCVEQDPAACLVLQRSFPTVSTDFLAWGGSPTPFDAVVMNPPFTGGQYLDHVLHAWEFVRPGGRLVAVVPRTYRTDRRAKAVTLRGLLKLHGLVTQDLPEDAFKESGTSVRASVLVLTKRKP